MSLSLTIAHGLNVALQLPDEALRGIERPLIAQTVRKLKPDRFAQELAVEIQQMGFYSTLSSAEGRCVADTDCCHEYVTANQRLAGINAVSRH